MRGGVVMTGLKSEKLDPKKANGDNNNLVSVLKTQPELK